MTEDMKFTNIMQQMNSLDLSIGSFLLAYSGGLDSTVLLHVLSRQLVRERLKAVHVHHGLSANADLWAETCARECSALGVEFFLEHVNLSAKGKGLESAARDARYKAVIKVATTLVESSRETAVTVLTAHHANDQTETLLYRVFRGSGLAGLEGIKKERKLAPNISVIRPLLSVSRAELAEYAKHFGLNYIEDESNNDPGYDRNYLRKEVMPAILKRWPAALKQVSRLSSLVSKEQALLNTYGLIDLKSCGLRDERMGSSIEFSKLLAWPENRRFHVMRTWAKEKAHNIPLSEHLEHLDGFLNANADKCPRLEWGDACLSRYRNRLYLLPRAFFQTKKQCDRGKISWDISSSCDLSNGFYLECDYLGIPPGQNRIIEDLDIKFRTGGERCRPKGRRHSQVLKKLLQEYSLEPWLRDAVPIIYHQERLIAVGDLFSCELGEKPLGELSFRWYYSNEHS